MIDRMCVISQFCCALFLRACSCKAKVRWDLSEWKRCKVCSVYTISRPCVRFYVGIQPKRCFVKKNTKVKWESRSPTCWSLDVKVLCNATTWYMCVFLTSLVALKRCKIDVMSCYMYIQCFFEAQHCSTSLFMLDNSKHTTASTKSFWHCVNQVTMGSLRWRHNSQCHNGSSNPAEALPAWACRDLRRSQWREHFDTSVALLRCSSTPYCAKSK